MVSSYSKTLSNLRQIPHANQHLCFRLRTSPPRPLSTTQKGGRKGRHAAAKSPGRPRHKIPHTHTHPTPQNHGAIAKQKTRVASTTSSRRPTSAGTKSERSAALFWRRPSRTRSASFRACAVFASAAAQSSCQALLEGTPSTHWPA